MGRMAKRAAGHRGFVFGLFCFPTASRPELGRSKP